MMIAREFKVSSFVLLGVAEKVGPMKKPAHFLIFQLDFKLLLRPGGSITHNFFGILASSAFTWGKKYREMPENFARTSSNKELFFPSHVRTSNLLVFGPQYQFSTQPHPRLVGLKRRPGIHYLCNISQFVCLNDERKIANSECALSFPDISRGIPDTERIHSQMWA